MPPKSKIVFPQPLESAHRRCRVRGYSAVTSRLKGQVTRPEDQPEDERDNCERRTGVLHELLWARHGDCFQGKMIGVDLILAVERSIEGNAKTT